MADRERALTEGREPGQAGSDVARASDSDVRRETLVWTAHLRTVVWLCWRLWQRRWHRHGSGYRGFGVLTAFLAVVVGCLSFLLALGLGWALLPLANPDTVLLTWAGLVAAFVFVRLIGAFGDLQQGDGLPLDNLLHLPFSLHQVFLLNFVLSQLTLATVIFVPVFLGLAIACTIALDVRNFVLVPASLSLVLCVAAVLYQVRGWITSAAGTKRRRVLIGYFVSMVLVAAFQVSYFLFLMPQIGSEPEATDAMAAFSELEYEGVPPKELDQVTGEGVRLSGEWLSGGWITDGRVDGRNRFSWLSVIGMVGLLTITVLSLRGGYRGTLARYRHPQTGNTGRRMQAQEQGRRIPARRARASPEVAIALVTLKHWLRSARALMECLPALGLLVLFGYLWFRSPGESDSHTLALTVIGLMSVFCFPMELARNLFGFDGHGFRVYRFAGVPARSLLLGKYLALLPLFILLAGATLAVTAALRPMLPIHTLGTIFQGGIVFMAGCVMGGTFSMSSPQAVSHTSMTTRTGCATTFLLLLTKLVIAGSLILVAWGALLAERAFVEDSHAFPVYLVVSMIEFGLAVVAFRVMLGRQARELVERSDHILDAVSVTE